MEGKRIDRNTDMNELFGLDEPALPADTAEEAPKESDEYQRWLEESLKENKGYGTKGTYEVSLRRRNLTATQAPPGRLMTRCSSRRRRRSCGWCEKIKPIRNVMS